MARQSPAVSCARRGSARIIIVLPEAGTIVLPEAGTIVLPEAGTIVLPEAGKKKQTLAAAS